MGWLLTALKTLGSLFGLGENIVAEVHDEKQRKAGDDRTTVAVQREALTANAKVLEVANNSDHDSVDDSLRTGSF